MLRKAPMCIGVGEGLNRQFIDIRELVDAEFRRNKRLHSGRIKCRSGCTDCCYQLFSISELEAACVSRAFSGLDEARRARVAARAEKYRAERESLLREFGYVEGSGNLPKAHLRLACPLLEDGRCLLYRERPLACRRFGMPVVHPADPTRVSACELNFRPGEVFEDPKLVATQSAIQRDWLALLKRQEEAGGCRAEMPISVADAILTEFRPHRSPDDGESRR